MLTLGGDGSVYLEAGQSEPVYQRAYRVEAVDTTAAGDTFTGYLVAGLARGLAPAAAMERASAAAAISVTRKGAAPSIPNEEEVSAFLQRIGAETIHDESQEKFH